MSVAWTCLWVGCVVACGRSQCAAGLETAGHGADRKLLDHRVSSSSHWLHQEHYAIRLEDAMTVPRDQRRGSHVVKAVEEAEDIERAFGCKVISGTSPKGHVAQTFASLQVPECESRVLSLIHI